MSSSLYCEDWTHVTLLKLLLSGSDQDVMDLHVRGTGENILDSLGDVLGLETLNTVVDSCHSTGIVWIHCRLELSLDQT